MVTRHIILQQNLLEMSPNNTDEDNELSHETRSDEHSSFPSVTTEEVFQDTLQALVIEADSYGIDVRGGWPVVRDDETQLWDIEITKMVR